MYINFIIAVENDQAETIMGWVDGNPPTAEEVLAKLPEGSSIPHAETLLEGDSIDLDGYWYQVVGGLV